MSIFSRARLLSCAVGLLLASVATSSATAATYKVNALRPAPISVTDAPGYAEVGAADPGLASSTAGTGLMAATGLGSTGCASGWHYIAGAANSFVTGNCSGGWTLTKSNVIFDSIHSWYWYGGNINGGYSGCGWMRTQDTSGTSSTGSSGCGNLALCSYIYCDANGNPFTYGGVDDGMAVAGATTCEEYLNYRPWLSGQSTTYPVRAMNAGTIMMIRYRAKYTYQGHYWYMARDSTVPPEAGQGNWVFVRDDCFG